MKNYEAKGSKLSDFKTVIDENYLYRYLLSKKNDFAKTPLDEVADQEEENQEVFEAMEVVNDNKSYKLKFTKKDVNNNVLVVLQTNFAKIDDEEICVEFSKIEGDAFEYHQIVNNIKNKINQLADIKVWDGREDISFYWNKKNTLTLL